MARTPIHPGEILADELEAIGLSAKRLADLVRVPPNRLDQILAGKRRIDRRYCLAARSVFRHLGRVLDESADRI